MTQGNTTGTVVYNHDGLALTSLTAASLGTYTPNLQGTVVVRRSSATPGTYPDNTPGTMSWNYTQTNTSSPAVTTVWGAYQTDAATLLATNNLFTGMENLFCNDGTAGGSPSYTITDPAANIERIDFIFGSGIVVAADQGFAVFERGLPGGSNAGFQIAAITSLASDVPASYGAVSTYAAGTATYGTGGLIPSGSDPTSGSNSFYYTIFGTPSTGGTDLNNRQGTGYGLSNQNIAGALVTTTSLAAAGTTIYGYSVFALDVTGTGDTLINWDNGTYYPQDTPFTEDNGSIDIVATGAWLYTVPEPGTSALLAPAALLLGWHRRPRRRAG